MYKQPKVTNNTKFYKYDADLSIEKDMGAILLDFYQEKNSNFVMLLQCQVRDTIKHFFYKDFFEDVFYLKISWKQKQNDTLSSVEQLKIEKVPICGFQKDLLKYKVYYENYGRHSTEKFGRITGQEFAIELKYSTPNIGRLRRHSITLYNK